MARVATVAAANQFLAAYLPRYNQQFAVPSAQAVDLHRPTPTDRTVDAALCRKTRRCLRKDFTMAHEGRLYQVRALNFHLITARPVSVAKAKPLSRSHCAVTPNPTDPWWKRWRPEHKPDISKLG